MHTTLRIPYTDSELLLSTMSRQHKFTFDDTENSDVACNKAARRLRNKGITLVDRNGGPHWDFATYEHEGETGYDVVVTRYL